LYVRLWPPPGNSLLFADAVGLALFTIMGSQIAEAAGLPAVIVVLMGTITGVAGGVLRDVICAEIPLILQRDIYATAAIAGASVYLILQKVGVVQPGAAFAGMAVVVVLRFIAIVRGLRLPVFQLPEETR
jgi:uncharacterized membrane protein YeiH